MNHDVENVQIGIIKQNCLYGDIKARPCNFKNASADLVTAV